VVEREREKERDISYKSMYLSFIQHQSFEIVHILEVVDLSIIDTIMKFKDLESMI